MGMCKQVCSGKGQCKSAAINARIFIADSNLLRAEKLLHKQVNEDNKTVTDIFYQMQCYLNKHHLKGKQIPPAKIPQLYKKKYGTTELWELELPLGLTVRYSYIESKIVIVDVV